MSRLRRSLIPVSAALTIGMVAALAFWAGRVALAPPADPLATEPASATFEVLEQTIGRSQRFVAEAQWQSAPALRAGNDGVVTSVDFAPGDVVEVGAVLYSVELRPVVAAQGTVPMFRDLRPGDAGADVTQLQAMLRELGFTTMEPNGGFDEATLLAVRAWQESMDMPADGIVPRGDIAFFAELPTRVMATESLAVGAPVTVGEVVVARLAPQPTLTIPLSVEQRSLVPLSAAVRVHHAGGTWDAVIARAIDNTEQGGAGLDLVLEAPTGGAVCADACIESIAPQGTTSFQAEVVIVPDTTGPVVPVGAIISGPGGEQSVEVVGRGEIEIEVLASTDGLAVVSGVDPGDVVVLPFAQAP